MNTSIVLTTYNGQKYILEQLNSILYQTVAPDEVLIFDDKSSDSTVAVVENFIAQNHLQNWKIVVNEQNKGWQENFIEGLEQAKGDIIFTCDQDDIWHPDKIKVMTNVFQNEPEARLVMCGYIRFESDAPVKFLPVNGHYYHKYSTSKNAKMLYPGCTFAFRHELFDAARQSWTAKFPHDLLIFFAGWISDKVYICEDELHFFRRHAESATHIAKPMLRRSKRVDWVKNNLNVLHDLSVLPELTFGKECKYVDIVLKWYSLRYGLLNDRKLPNAIKLIGYYKCYDSILTWGADVYVSIKPKRRPSKA